MIVKFFANKGGGAEKASIRYLLGKPADKVNVLSGYPQLSLSIADNLDFNHKYTVGCLSFEELHINEDDKHKIMEYFENTIFAGLEPEQFNITWIEHTDKERLELNFFIPNVEMTTQRKLQPYYDKLDRPLIENFKQVTNQKYKLSDPNSPEKKQLFIATYKLPKDKQQATETINNSVLKMTQNGIISNGDDVIRHLEKTS